MFYYRATACNASATHGINANAFLSACLSIPLAVRLSNAWIVTKRNKLMPTVLYHINFYETAQKRRY